MAKGGAFENEIAKSLSLWITEGERDDIFGRSDGSGGRFTARRKRGKDTANQGGDITFTDIIGEPLIRTWSIECKTGYGGKKRIKDDQGKIVKKIDERWDVLDYIDSQQKETVLDRMWEQCCRDAHLTNRIPVLIFRRNRRSPCIMIPCRHEHEFIDIFGVNPSIKIIITNPIENVVIMKLKDFFKWLPGNFLEALPSRKKSKFKRRANDS